MELERRVVANVPECRASDDGQRISGYGALFNVEAVIRGQFRERIEPGAFADLIGPGADVRSAYNHNPDFLLGRTTAGTLRLMEDATGLRYETDINQADPNAVSVAAKVQRRDVTGSSFAFGVDRDGQEWVPPSTRDELPLRIIKRFSVLAEVGPVAFPAYEQTTAEARDAATALQQAAEIVSRSARAEAERQQAQARLRWAKARHGA